MLDRFAGADYEECTADERTLFLDNSRSFSKRLRRRLIGRKDRTVAEKDAYMPEIYGMDDVYLYGYWMRDLYYSDISGLLRKKLCFPKSDNLKNTAMLAQLEEDADRSVSIHIRRKDYLTVADGKRYMGICTDEYYRSAVSYVNERVENPIYYIFSDDSRYAEEYFEKEIMGGCDVHICDRIEGDDCIFDMQLMSRCAHNICANSTFSEWGARLNANEGKIAVRPLRHDNYETESAKLVHESWQGWTLIDSDGRIAYEK